MTYSSANKRLETYVGDAKTQQSNIDGSTDFQGVVTTESGRKRKTLRISGNTTLNGEYEVIFCDTDSGGFEVTLDSIANGFHYKISNVGTSGNAVTLTPDGTDKLFTVNASELIHDGEIFDIDPEATEGWM